MSRLLIAADSRGAKLGNYFNRHYPSWNVDPIVVPGGTVQTLHSLIVKALTASSPTNTNVFIAAGICNLTEKTEHEGGVEVSYTNDTRGRVSNLLYGLHTLISDINSRFSLQVHVCTNPPANLLAYRNTLKTQRKLHTSIYTTSQIISQQAALENDIKLINLEILQMNTSQGLAPIRWDRQFIKIKIQKRGELKENSRKKSKYNYQQLYDGLHPNWDLAAIWYLSLAKSVLHS